MLFSHRHYETNANLWCVRWVVYLGSLLFFGLLPLVFNQSRTISHLRKIHLDLGQLTEATS